MAAQAWIGKKAYLFRSIWQHQDKPMRPERLFRIRQVVKQRQRGITVVLENVHDPFNISAVLRSCDSVGIAEIYVLYTDPRLQGLRKLKLGTKTSGGAVKWVQVHVHYDLDECFSLVRQRYGRILATVLGERSISLYEMDFSKPTALLFGNEHKGVSPEAFSASDGSLYIPQMGMAKSLNISVACAVTLYEAMRQRMSKGFYGSKNPAPESYRQKLLDRYLDQA